jgi:7,8-dihydroneopterin aldolase/epimerase/oxygenase
MKGSHNCWIHVRGMSAFLYLGANPHEQKVGQNIKLDLSISIPYTNTNDDLCKTLDYGILVKDIHLYLESLGPVNLLEFLAEQILDNIGIKYPGVAEAKIIITKGYVPLTHFTGSVSIEARRDYSSDLPR